MSSWAEGMVGLVRKAGVSSAAIQLAVMDGPSSCHIGDLKLAAEDLKFMDGLLTPTCTKVAGTCPDETGPLRDTSTYRAALKSGDTVAVYQLSDTAFLVLGKVVTAT